jgi:hypothetical protein
MGNPQKAIMFGDKDASATPLDHTYQTSTAEEIFGFDKDKKWFQ